MRKILIAFILSISTISVESFAQTKIYKLKSIASNADFNYKKLEHFDDILKVETAFIPVKKGKYKVYTFIATFKDFGLWLPDEKKMSDSLVKDSVDVNGYRILTKEEIKQMNKLETFHDILIVKTNSKNEIIDAYHYTLEWAEPELSYDLFRSTTKNQKLTNGLSIDKLKFYRTQIGRDKEPLDERGIIRLK
jgi:hypothetical protein